MTTKTTTATKNNDDDEEEEKEAEEEEEWESWDEKVYNKESNQTAFMTKLDLPNIVCKRHEGKRTGGKKAKIHNEKKGQLLG